MRVKCVLLAELFGIDSSPLFGIRQREWQSQKRMGSGLILSRAA